MLRHLLAHCRPVLIFALALSHHAATCAEARASTVLYVDHAATGAGDGTSWQDAFHDLRDALLQASAVIDDMTGGEAVDCVWDADAVGGASHCGEPLVEIWMAEGTYHPDAGTGDRGLSFLVPPGVGLFGGFAGWESDLCLRDRDLHPVVLSGDLAGNDIPGWVPTSPCCDDRPYQDEAHCDDAGCTAAVIASDQRCASWESWCARRAQDVCGEVCQGPHAENSFTVLRALSDDPWIVVDGVDIVAGNARSDDPVNNLTGGIYLRARFPDEGAMVVRNCTIAHHRSVGSGSGLFCSASTASIVDSKILDNAEGALDVGNCRAYVHGSAFVGNDGGVLAGKTSIFSDCVFRENTYGVIVFTLFDWVTLRNCEFTDNLADEYRGGAAVSNSGLVEIYDSRFRGNVTLFEEGGAFSSSYLTASIIDGCEFVGNSGAINQATTSPAGGAIHNGGEMYLSNSVLAGNRARSAGAISNAGALVVSNCTIADNAAVSYGSALRNDDEVTLESSIVWGRIAGVVLVGSPRPEDPFGTVFSIVDGLPEEPDGSGNSGAAPVFVAPGHWVDPGTPDDPHDDTWVHGDYRLCANSPAIDTGHPGLAGDETSTDLAGHPRVLCGRVDIGAYEFGTGDYNCDRSVALDDFAHWAVCESGPIAPAGNDGPEPGDPLCDPTCRPLDFDMSCTIDLADFARFQAAFLDSCP